MSHVSNFTQDPKKILLDLINEDNNMSLTVTTVDVTIPAIQQPVDKNTNVRITSLPGSGYSGNVTLEYNRLAIGGFTDLYYPGGLTIPLGDATTLVDLIPEIEAGLAIKLTEGLDFNDMPIEEWEGIPNETQVFEVPILETSYVFTGSLEFILDGNDIPLAGIITETVLDGLNLPGSAEPETQYLETRYAGVDYSSVPGNITFVGEANETLPAIQWRFISDGNTSDWVLASDYQNNFSGSGGVMSIPIPPLYDSALGQLEIRSLPGYDATERVSLRTNVPIARIAHFQTDEQPFVMFDKPNLVMVPSYLPRSARSIEGMFGGAAFFNDDTVALWDVSRVERMGYVFGEASIFNRDISGWNTANVEDMEDIFWGALAFNQDLSGWNVGKVTNFDGFDGNTPAWDEGNKPVFEGGEEPEVPAIDPPEYPMAYQVNVPGGGDALQLLMGEIRAKVNDGPWVIYRTDDYINLPAGEHTLHVASQAVDNLGIAFECAFYDNSLITELLSLPSSGLVVRSRSSALVAAPSTINGSMTTDNLSGLFEHCHNFNQDISGWDMSYVRHTEFMFAGAFSFNQDISGWNVSGFENMSSMFYTAVAFNQDLSDWDFTEREDLIYTNYDMGATAWVADRPQFYIEP